MANDTTGHAHSAPGSGPDPAVSALMEAVQMFIATLAGDVPFGAAAGVLERINAVHEQVDQLIFAMLVPLAQMEASGELLEAGGQKSLKAYLTHAWGIPHGDAERLMYLARNLHKETLPETASALAEGSMSVGEAAAIASGAEREVKKRDAKTHPDADAYRSRIDTGLAGLKAQKPATSVKTLTSTAHALGLELNPDRPEANEEREFAARGARLHSSFAGFTFEAWGPASDGERLKAALASFTAPYGSTEKTPADTNGATASGGTGSDTFGVGVIPTGESVTSRYARTYDALISAAGFAHSHHSHGTTNGAGKASSPGTKGAPANDYASAAGTGADTGLFGDADGAATGGPATGAGAGAGPVGDTDGGGCSQPPGTKAVINITVPLSALLGFGFAFNNDTNADAGAAGATAKAGTAAGGTNTTGAAITAPGPEPGAGSGAHPGAPPGACTDTGPPSTTTDSPAYVGAPGSPGSPGYPGALASSGVAMTEDGTVLALSAVRAMALNAQIRRLIFDDRTGLPLDLGRAHRLAPGYLRTAAFMGHTTCAWSDGCDVPVSQCEADHITEFTHGGATTATNLQPLCSTHNRLKYRRSRTENTPTNGTGAGAKGGSGAEATDSDNDHVGTG